MSQIYVIIWKQDTEQTRAFAHNLSSGWHKSGLCFVLFNNSYLGLLVGVGRCGGMGLTLHSVADITYSELTELED